MSGRRKVLVAGAGVLGLTTALALADAGLEVAVHDPAPPGDNASGVAAGMLAPAFEAALDPLARLHFDLLTAARDLWPALAERAGIVLDRTAALAVGDAAWLEEAAERVRSLGAGVRAVDRAGLEAAAPGLAAAVRHGFAVEGDWRLDAPAALAALRRAGEAAGVAFHQAAVDGAAGFDLLVVATGAGRMLIGLAPELARLTPIKGHILRGPGALGAVLRSSGAYAVPAAGGLLVGASMEPGRDDRRVDSGQVGRLRAAAARLFPLLAEAPMTAAVGVRAATADGLPLVGPSAAPGVLIAAGARRNGWLLAPLVAQAVAAYAAGAEPGPFAARLDPRRTLSSRG
ncbi:FAD-dependent oxidoreductase [Phenylobacterium sp.]|jgi:glycine oxidase|uniref:NAD(P)/FAD-dependent oxidoreductase n=1 Tax=Phenylobacterium sp. TaxID=1871053 RepID=UPI002F41A945